MVLYDGETIKGENDKIINFKFSKSDFSLNSFETNTITQYKIQETKTIDLFKCIINLSKKSNVYLYENCSSNNLNNIFVEILKRILIPIYIPILVMISLLLIIKPKEDNFYSKLKLITFIVGVLIIIISETSLRFVQDDIMKNLKIIILPIIIFTITYINFYLKFKLKQNRNLS